MFVASALFAQPRDIKFDHLTIADGLSKDVVVSFFQDRYGFMWISTLDGLNRYDGYSFKIYKHNPHDSTTIPENFVTWMYEDRKGRLWLTAGGSGLVLYDRDTDRFRRATPHAAISGGIIEDAEGKFWIGTSEGLLQYDERSGKEVWYRHDPNDSTSINSNGLGMLLLDRSGTLWICTGNGFCKFDRERNTFTRYLYVKDRTYKVHDFDVALFEDSKGNIWITQMGGGLWRLDTKKNRLDHFAHDPSNQNTPSHRVVCGVNEDKYGRIWVGTFAGLDILDPTTGVFTHYAPNRNDPSALWGIRAGIFRDKNDAMWVATGVVNRYDPNKQKFRVYRNNPNDKNSLGNNEVNSVIEDKSGIVWIGTEEGLNRLDRRTNTFTRFRSNPKDPNSLGGYYISAVYEDRQGKLWVASSNKEELDGYLDMLDRNSGKFVRVLKKPVKTIFEDSDGELWLGLYDERENLPDLIRLDVNRKLVETYTILGSGVLNIYQDRTGYLWMGGQYCCLRRFDKKTNSFTFIDAPDPTNPKKEGIGNVRATCEDSSGMFWFATSSRGLLRYDPRTNNFTTILESDGLPSDFLKGILPDETGNLWISTDKGLTRFNPHTNTFRTFTEQDGLQGMSFISGSYFKGKNGWMYFGGTNGLNIFHPDSIKDNPNSPPIVITSFKIFDKEQRPGGLGDVKEIQLSYNQNHFSFEFAALDYTDPKRNQYAYKMEGVDKDWVYSGTRRFASYTNLNPGTYTFRVKGSNNDGVWNEAGTSLTLIITPPWWRTAWAYTVYVALIGSALFGIRRFEKNRERMKFQMEMKHREAERLKEVDQMKSRFFANISHEFRTPLTLILGPIHKWKETLHSDERSEEESRGQMGDEILRLRSASAQNVEKDLNMMERNAQRLLRLINQLLDLSKIEAGGMKLQAAAGNIVPFVKGIAQSFESSAGKRNIALNVETESDEIEVYFDRDKMEKILSNLLSNAFKFTPEGGEVTVSIDRGKGRRGDGERGGVVTAGEQNSPPLPLTRSPIRSTEGVVQITVKDTGIGIPSEQLDKVFDRFYQVDASQTREQEGSGIGLALTKELVELHHGTIEVKSEVGKGSEFIVRLPLGKAHLKDEEVVETLDTESRMGEGAKGREGDISSVWSPSDVSPDRPFPDSPTLPVSLSVRDDAQLHAETSGQTAPLVLIIEDNADVRAYIRSYLAPQYRVLESRDGVEGVARAKETIPDLIISDLMMPKMDGYEVCKRLKQDEKTSHVPIILLTAKAGSENKIEGLETGADDYLTKPFDAKELLVRVKNLIDLRRKLRERFSVGQVLKPGEVAVKSMDDVFLQKVIAVVEARMGDERFSVEDLGKDVNMSRYQLHRKLTALTNMAAGDFIRYMRLQRARDLLEKNAATISEIAYTVGFGNVPYFTKCFREQFGVVPSEVNKR